MEEDQSPVLTELLRQGRTFSIHRGRLGAAPDNVVLKTFAEGATGVRAAERLENEFAITRGLTHEHIIRAEQHIHTEHGPMLVFADGGHRSLDAVTGSPVDPYHVQGIAIAMAEALEYLHSKGVIHRDIKPSNIVAPADLSTAHLIDFCLAIRVEADANTPKAMLAEGTPAYMAPEQTGRMNRGVDARADLYSLGITLYELLTARRPFDDESPATVFHRHLTEVPPPPAEVIAEVPSRLSDIVMRLIAKNPEDRFQSASDLLLALRGGRTSAATGPGLVIPDRLYGRDALIVNLVRTLTQAKDGETQLIRLGGQSGIGKSAVIEALIAPVTTAGGTFVQGKFDQFDRTRPYGAILDAFNALLRKLLSGTAADVEAWRTRLLDALSPNAQVLLDILPRYEALLGPQPPVAELGLNEAQIRMSLVFRRFVKALCQAEAPLVMFLDDLQWSDSASRALIELLLTDPEIRHFTLLTAYRDNEIGPAHPVRVMISSLEGRCAVPPEHVVGPLTVDCVCDLLIDALESDRARVQDVAAMVHAKTGGNPFFVRQFLMALNRKGLLRRTAEGGFTWDLAQLRAEQITDNVADLVVERILELPPGTQDMVRLAACMGTQVDLDLLARASDRAGYEVVRALEPAVRAEVLTPIAAEPDEAATHYRFQHDRVQSAANSMLAADRRAEIHARLGALMLERVPTDQPDAQLMEVTDHLIAGRRFLDAGHLGRLRDLSLRAARQSKAANAYDAALCYLSVTNDILGADAWAKSPDLMFSVTLETAEAAYLQGDDRRAEKIATALLERPLDALDQVRVFELMILIHTGQIKYLRALTVGLRALSLLGVRLPERPKLPRVLRELLITKAELSRRSDENLLNMRRMKDPHKKAAMRVLVLLAPPAYFSAPNLLPLIALRMVRMSVRYGNAPASAYGYVIYGMLHCAVLGDPKRGLAYGELARQAAINLGAQDIEGRILMVFAGFIQHWTAPLEDTLPVYREAMDKAISAGDLEYHGYSRYGHASYALMSGMALPKVSEFLTDHLAAVMVSPHEKTRRVMTMARASIGRMRGLPDDTYVEVFDEVENFALWSEQADATSLAYFHKYKMLEALMAGDYATTLDHARSMAENENGILSMAYQGFYQFYEALCLIELSTGQVLAQRMASRSRAKRLMRRQDRWARHAPRTFQHRALLLRAEIAALDGKTGAAMKRFEEAIAAARRAGALHDVGVFLERAALFYSRVGATEAARRYLPEALTALEIWGANGWANALRDRHGALIPPAAAPKVQDDSSSDSSSTSTSQSVDAATVIRAASALAQQVSLKDVVTGVMRAMVVNAGAERGVLLLREDDTMCVAAEMDARGDVQLLSGLMLEDHEGLPHSIANYVLRSGDRIVLDDITVDRSFADDPYIRRATPASALCAPLLSKGEVVGIVYLENAQVLGAFTAERCATVQTLGTQAAVSIENAQLYDELRTSLERQVELTSAHARFVPHHFLETIGRPSITDVKLGDHVQAEASILFSDIRGFTSLVEAMEPADAIEFINTYLSKMEPAVQAGGGFVDSYVGDAVMAVFDRGPEAALDAAITMMRDLRAWTRRREAEGHIPIRIGIGIASGEMIFGTIGAANRMKCGVIGDTVNLAARIEGLTKHYNLGLLISQGTYRTLPDPDRYLIREVDLVTVVGREAPVRLFEVFDADPRAVRDQKLRVREDVARGLRLYRSGAIDQAAELFQQCRAVAPDDPLLLMLTERCRRHADLARDPEWTGIERIERK